MSGTKVADLFGLVGFKVDQGSMSRAEGALNQVQNALGSLKSLATAAFAGFTVQKVLEEGLKFNANIEDTKTQIAGMLSLAKHTDLADQLGAADQLMASLQERAKQLPGSTADYTKVLGMIAQPITDAGIGLKDLEDITVGTAVAAKAMSIDLEAGARDVNQAIMGQFHSVDQLTGRILGSLGYVGEAGRKRFNDLSKAQRAAVLKQALTQKQLAQLADAQSKNASGRWDTLKANVMETLGRVTLPLFKRVSEALGQVNDWINRNQKTVDKWTDAIGTGLVMAVEEARTRIAAMVQWIQEHPELIKSLKLLIGLIIWWNKKLVSVVGYIADIAEAFISAFIHIGGKARDAVERIIDGIGDIVSDVKDAASTIGDAFTSAFDAVRDVVQTVFDFIAEKVKWIEDKVDWVIQKARDVASFVGLGDGPSGFSQVTQQAAPQGAGGASFLSPFTPTVPGPSSATTTTTVQNNLTAPINVNGAASPEATAKAVSSELSKQFANAYDSRRGGRR